MGGRTVDADRSRSWFPGKSVGDDATALGDVPDVDLLPRYDVSGLEKIGVDRHASLVFEVGLRDRGPVNFRVQHRTPHGSKPPFLNLEMNPPRKADHIRMKPPGTSESS